MERVTFTLTVLVDSLTRARTRHADDEIAEVLQAVVDQHLAHLAREASEEFVRATSTEHIRLFHDLSLTLWCAWVDVCKLARVSNPYNEGMRMTRVQANVGTGARSMLLIPVSEVCAWLSNRRANVGASRMASGELLGRFHENEERRNANRPSFVTRP